MHTIELTASIFDNVPLRRASRSCVEPPWASGAPRRIHSRSEAIPAHCLCSDTRELARIEYQK